MFARSSLAETLALNLQKLLNLLESVSSLGLLRLRGRHSWGFLNDLLSKKGTLDARRLTRRHVGVLRLSGVLSALLLPEGLAASAVSFGCVTADAVALFEAHGAGAGSKLDK